MKIIGDNRTFSTMIKKVKESTCNKCQDNDQ